MSKNVLIAALGEHPAVVTGMVKALREIAGINIDALYVVYSENAEKYIDREGLGMIIGFLQQQCEILPVPLPFPDPNTCQTSIQCLRILAEVLETCRDATRYKVYLSLAGGRKNTSALMALVTQFFPAVRGLYHLLDRREGKPGAVFPSIEEMELTMTETECLAALDPPLENLNLIPVPYPGAFANAERLWQFINNPEQQETLTLSPEAAAFYRAIFCPQSTESLLEVWLSRTAVEQYEKLGNEDAERFRRCFLEMRNPRALKDALHHRERDLCVYKRTHRQRPFFYTTPHDIAAFPQKPVERVIVCGLSVEYARRKTGPYEPDIVWQVEHACREPYRRLAELDARECILLVPLGQSPMIVTQTYTLLRENVEAGRPQIPLVAVIYPEQNGAIYEGVRLLERQFRLKNVDFCPYPVPELRDVDSTAACEAYLGALLATIENLRQKYPNRQIALSLSGGRKGMSALTLLAAQRANITQIYHTLIADAAMERQIEEETSLEVLKKLPTDAERARRLFLQAYEIAAFELFAIPVIPVQ